MLEIIEATARNPMNNRPEFRKQVNLLKYTENRWWEWIAPHRKGCTYQLQNLFQCSRGFIDEWSWLNWGRVFCRRKGEEEVEINKFRMGQLFKKKRRRWDYGMDKGQIKMERQGRCWVIEDYEVWRIPCWFTEATGKWERAVKRDGNNGRSETGLPG